MKIYNFRLRLNVNGYYIKVYIILGSKDKTAIN